MAAKEIEGIFKENKVFIHLQEDADSLLESGYGIACEREGGSVLASYETLYLLSEGRMRVTHGETGKALNPKTLLEKFSLTDSEAWTKYLVYRDLRSRGYVVREGVGWGINFRVYERGVYGEKAAKFMVFAVCEGTPIPAKRLNETLTMAQNIKKEIIVAVMDRRGEIVYYALSQLNL